MKVSADGKVEGPDGAADWVEAWSEDYGLMPQIDACVLGAGMYPGYEWYWSTVRNEPDKPIWITGNAPTPAELEWARFAAQTPHYVLLSTLSSTQWPNTSLVRTLDDIAALKQQPGKDIYLARPRLRPASGIRQIDSAGSDAAGFSGLANGGTEILMRGKCLGAISTLRLLFHWRVPERQLQLKSNRFRSQVPP
jgi:hypothetical protein